MGRPRRNPDESRHDKHAPGIVRIPLNVPAEAKAILAYTAAINDKTMKDLLVDEGMKVARESGVVDENGKVTEAHRGGVSLTLEIINGQYGD